MLSVYRLPNHLPGEKVVRVVRRDLFILFKRVLFNLFLFVLPMLLTAVVIQTYPGILAGQVSYPVFLLAASGYYLFIWLFFFFSFIDYYLDIWIITSERIIDVQQQGFFSRVIAEQRLYRIQDVTSEAHGFWPTVLKYGDVHVQTAGTKQRFYFHQIPRPDEVRNEIIRLAETSKHKHRDEIVREESHRLESALEHKL